MRRRFLGLLALTPAAGLLPAAGVEAKDYASAREALDDIDGLEADVESRLRALAAAVPQARRFAASLIDDHERHRAERARLRRRLGLGAAVAPVAAASDTALDSLRAVQEALVYAHAEGMPVLGDRQAVDTLARHMVDLSRHLTVIDLWIEAEGQRG